MNSLGNCDLCVGSDEFRYIEDLGDKILDLIVKGQLSISRVIILNYHKYGSMMRIRPSISLCVDSEGYSLFNDLSEIIKSIDNNSKVINEEYNCLQEKNAYQFIINYSIECGYRILRNDELKIVFLVKDNDEKNEENNFILNNLFKIIYTFKKNSLNIYNDSNRKTKEIVSEIRESQIFSHSKELTLNNIVSYFKKDYSHQIKDIYIYQFNFNDNTWRMIGDQGSSLIYDDLIEDKSDKIFYKGNKSDKAFNKSKGFYPRVPLSGKKDDEYYLIFPFVKDYNTEYFKYIILLTSKTPIKKYICINLNTVINDYYNYYLENEKEQLLHVLQGELTILYAQAGYYAGNRKNELLKQYVENTFRTIVAITNAYSASMHLYNPYDNSLDLFVDICMEDSERSDPEEFKKIFIKGNKIKNTNCRVYAKINKKDNPYLFEEEDMKDEFLSFLKVPVNNTEKHLMRFFPEGLITKLKNDCCSKKEFVDIMNNLIIKNNSFFDQSIFDKDKILNRPPIRRLIDKKRKNDEDYQKLNRLILEKYYPQYIRGYTENYIYEPNLIKTKDNRELNVRTQTVSEICFPLYFKNMKIGVVDFESPILNAFDDETDNKKCFISFVVELIEEYIRILNEVNDIKWLSRLVVKENNLHELKQIINSLDVIPGETKHVMKKLLACNNVTLGKNDDIKLSEVSSFKEKFINSIVDELKSAGLPSYTDEIINGYGNALSIDTEHGKDVLISGDRMEMIKIIYNNLANNFSKFCNYEKDKLTLRYSSKSHAIVIQLCTHSPLPIDYNDYYFDAPYESSGNNSSTDLHSGLFIIGVLVRQLSGFINTKKNESGYIDNIIIRIPIK